MADIFIRELFAQLQLRHHAHCLRQAGHGTIVKVRRRDRHVTQLRYFEHEGISLVFGVVKTTFVIAFECVFGRAAGHQPIILGDAEFLVGLTAHGHAVMATGATGVDECVQTQFGCFGQRLGIAFQKLVKRCGREQRALISANRLAPVFNAHRLGIIRVCGFEQRQIAQLRQFGFHLLIGRIAISQRTDHRFVSLLFYRGAVTAVMLCNQQRRIEHSVCVAGQLFAMHANCQRQ